MALDFPSNPADGEVFGSYIWSASKGVWQAREESAAPAVTSPVPPANPSNGDIWFDSSDGISYVYYDDGSTGQWVEMISSGVPQLNTKANLDGGNTFTGTQTLSTPLAITSGGTGAASLNEAQKNLQIPLSHNYIINGAFDVWQRNTSFSSVAGGTYTADRWLTQTNATAQTVTRVTDTPTTYGYALRLQRATGTFSGINQRIEAITATNLINKIITVSFWAKTPLSNQTVRAQLTYPSATDNYGTFTVFQTLSTAITSTWTQYSFTFNTLTSVFATGLELRIGSNSSGDSTHDLYIANVQLEEGGAATPFKRHGLSIGGEIAACQRYFSKSYDQEIVPGTNNSNGICSASVSSLLTTFAGSTARFPVTMRTTPTSVTVYAPNGTAGQADAVGFGNVSITAGRIGASGIGALDVASGRSGGTILLFHYIASAEL